MIKLQAALLAFLPFLSEYTSFNSACASSSLSTPIGAQLFAEALPFADKAYVTDLAVTVDADSYAPDMASLVEAGMWREAEVGEWRTPAKEESGIDSYRFRILVKTK